MVIAEITRIDEKGFGFVRTADGNLVFFHRSTMKRPELFNYALEGRRAQIEIGMRRGKREVVILELE